MPGSAFCIRKTPAFMYQVLQIGSRDIVFHIIPGKVGIDHRINIRDGAFFFAVFSPMTGHNMIFFHRYHLAVSFPAFLCNLPVTEEKY